MNGMRRWLVGAWLGACALAGATAAGATAAGAQIPVGQRDDFQDGTTANWRINLLGIGNPPPEAIPQVVAGGLRGPADRYLRLTSTGNAGAGGRLAVLNYGSQWAGDWRAVTGVTLLARNFGASEVTLRLLFENPALPPTPGPPDSWAVSTVGAVLPAGGDWTQIYFPLRGPGGLGMVPGSALGLDALLAGVTTVRLFHLPVGAALSPVGPPIAAQVGIDDFTAAPEPGTLALAGGGLAVLALAARRRRAG